MKGRIFEIIIGIATIAVFAVFLGFVLNVVKNNNGGSASYYTLKAKFSNVDGIVLGSQVKLSGVKVGEVKSIKIDDAYYAVVAFSIDKKIKVPDDSSLSITASGLIGSNYLLIMPGSSDIYLSDGSAITLTQSAVNLGGLISKFVVGKS